jgi:hypothetical protein
LKTYMATEVAFDAQRRIPDVRSCGEIELHRGTLVPVVPQGHIAFPGRQHIGEP